MQLHPSPSPDQMAEDAARRMFDARVGKLHHLFSPRLPPPTLPHTPSFHQMAEDAARRMFDARVGKLHHLVSTATQPGVFNSPYAAATGSLPAVMGAPVEDHLKASMKAQVGTMCVGGRGANF